MFFDAKALDTVKDRCYNFKVINIDAEIWRCTKRRKEMQFRAFCASFFQHNLKKEGKTHT